MAEKPTPTPKPKPKPIKPEPDASMVLPVTPEEYQRIVEEGNVDTFLETLTRHGVEPYQETPQGRYLVILTDWDPRDHTITVRAAPEREVVTGHRKTEPR